MKKQTRFQLTPQVLHHKLMLILVIPILLWVVSGCYFVWLDLGFIRGDHYQQPSVSVELADDHITFNHILARYPQAENIELVMLAGSPYYRVYLQSNSLLVNASSGLELTSLPKSMALNIARSVMQALITVHHSQLLTNNGPSELDSRHLPVWQISFNDQLKTTIYVSAQSGEIVTRRHDLWRIFDLFWRFHIMDYDDGADIDNPLLFITTLLTLIAVICGVIWQLKWLKRGRL